ncbi:hypothetical protein RB653_000665 [Dictyostelium firmibasis]|uniref:Carboxylic ester hydrolase n=1 Tax=Dictyostelium firmibasis TaxID=79012 RepID=A0AAN7U323_9MYCE
MKILNLLLLIILVSSIDSCFSLSSKNVKRRLFNNEEDVVSIKDGLIRGTIIDSHRVFYGIPFARPPVGELRFEDPIFPKGWKNVKDCTRQKEQCIQDCKLSNGACSQIGTSEDCLYLDVFVPRKLENKKSASIPVMVFIPGGSFIQGTGSCALYEASKFANSSVIVVNLNYRLGALGFMGTDLLSGNFGFLDQVIALQWVRSNIEAFGGDKNQVTIFGESAGASSVVAHLISERSKNLFQRAIVSSGPFTLGFKTKSQARGISNRFSSKIGCNIEDIECLRSKTTKEILKAQSDVEFSFSGKLMDIVTVWTPVVDCDILPAQPLTMIRDGILVNNVPLIIGETKDEGNLFVYLNFNKKISPNKYKNIVSSMFGSNSHLVLNKYPAAPDNEDCRPILSTLYGDYVFRCSNRYLINKLIQHSSKSLPVIYHYLFKHALSSGHPIPYCSGIACHSSELSMIFNTYESALGLDLDDEEIHFSEDISRYWINFVSNGNPNNGLTSSKMIDWSPISKSLNNSLIMLPDFQSKDIISSDEKCDLFDKISYKGYTKKSSKLCPS